MSIRIKCVCGARLKAPDASMGKSVRCSVCGNAVYVPGARSSASIEQANREVEAWIRVVCGCGKIIKAPPEWAGKKGHCPRCGNEQIMPTAAPSNVPGEHDAENVDEVVEGPKPLKSLVKEIEVDTDADDSTSPASDSAQPAAARPGKSGPKPLRPMPRPQPKADENSLQLPGVDPDHEDEMEKFVDGQTLRKSGLLDLTGKEEVKIVDGVAPAIWDAKRAQRAKALKASPNAQAGYYRRRALTDQIAELRRRIDEVLYKKPAVTLALSAVLLAASALFLYKQITASDKREHWSPPVAEAYYYDLDNNKLFVHSDADPPPIAVPGQSGGAPRGVRAHVFACGKCEDESARSIGFLETYDPKTDGAQQFKRFRELMATVGPSNESAEAEDKAEAGRLISGPSASAWLPASSPDAQEMIAIATRPCANGSGAPKPCNPPPPK